MPLSKRMLRKKNVGKNFGLPSDRNKTGEHNNFDYRDKGGGEERKERGRGGKRKTDKVNKSGRKETIRLSH